MAEWLTSAAVASFAQIDDQADDALADAVAAAAAFVERVRPEFATPAEGETPAGYAPPDDVKLGAILLASRLFARRGTALGVAGFADYAGATPILRFDPDIEQMLRIGRHRPFDFGAPPLPVEEETA